MVSMAQDEAGLLRLLHSTEHSFVERKTIGDSKDWVKSVVAFANTLQIDQVGVLFIGATNDGEIQDANANLDSLQKTFSQKIESAYPSIYYTTQIVRENGKECLAVVVPGSPSKPHFSGAPFIRDGSRTIVPSSDRYDALLAARTGKAYELQRWEGKLVTARLSRRQNGVAYVVNQSTMDARVVSANQFFLTISYNNRKFSFPLGRVEISFDHVADRLEVQIEEPAAPF